MLNILSSAGASILASCVYCYRSPTSSGHYSTANRVPANPWEATGLEWKTPSPPPTVNFIYDACGDSKVRTPIRPPKRVQPSMASAVRHDFHMRAHRIRPQTAVSAMWLFLATEVLFFGGLDLELDLLASLEPNRLRCRRS